MLGGLRVSGVIALSRARVPTTRTLNNGIVGRVALKWVVVGLWDG